MKRLTVLLVLLTTAALSAQQAPRFRVRWATGQQAGAALPIVVITSPTTQPSFTTNLSSIVLGGTALSTSTSPIVEVRWTNDRGGSGVASLASEWATSQAGGASVVVQDDFSGANNIQLHALNASPIGGAWDEALNSTGGTSFYLERKAAGYVQINSNLGNGTIVNTVAPATALAGTNYDVAVTLRHIENPDGDDGAALIFGYQDSNNYCAAMWYGPAAATDLYITKKVAGTTSTIGTPFAGDVATGDVLTIEVRGTALTFKQNGVSRVTVGSDTFCDDGTGVGLGIGGFRGVASDDAAARWRFDDFTVSDQDGGAGAISLQAGVNVITVTAEDGLGNEGTDTISITRDVADNVGPQVTIIQPTTSPTYVVPPSAATFTVSGQSSDNIGVTSVTWACAQCTVASGTATLNSTTGDWSFSVTAQEGSNSIVVTALDAAKNPGTDTLTATLTAGDATPPVTTVTTNGGVNFSQTTNTVTIAGTATDAVGVLLVTGSCDTGTVGTVAHGTGTSVAWSAPVTLAPGANVCTFIATDANGNAHSDSITVTFNQPLNITTNSIAPVTEDAAMSSVTLQVVGGTAPYTWTNNGAGTSLNDGDAECAGMAISGAGVISGTPTTAGLCSFTAKVTDDSGGACPGAACDTQALTITVNAAGAATAHAYYDALITDPSCFKAYSLRPLAGQTTPITTTVGVADCAHGRWVDQIPEGSSAPLFDYQTYDFAGDTDAQKQDAMKVVIPVFDAIGFWDADGGNKADAHIVGAINDTTTTITLSRGGQNFENNKSWLIGGPWPDGEIVTQTARVGDVATVKRGQFGTTAISHLDGATVQRANNTIHDGTRRFQIRTDGSESAVYLYTWDTYWTDSYVNTGIDAHKLAQISTWKDDQQFIEFKPIYRGISNANFNLATDVAAITTRWYTQSFTAGFFSEPGSPIRDESNNPTYGFLVKPATWYRVWYLVEANSESDHTKFADSGQDLASPGGINDTTTSIVVTHNLGCGVQYLGGTTRCNFTNPFTSAEVVEGANQAWPGRKIKIDDEIMTVVSGPTSQTDATPRTITVRRAQGGTVAASHAEGAAIHVIHDYVSAWVADENNNARMIANRIAVAIAINHADPQQRGSMRSWWSEWNTSFQELSQGRAQALNNARNGDQVGYMRNLVVLKNPASCTASNCAAYLTKPVR